MTQEQLSQLGKTLWAIADDLRGAWSEIMRMMPPVTKFECGTGVDEQLGAAAEETARWKGDFRVGGV